MADLKITELRSIFDHYDRDRSGYIDASEWSAFLRVLDPSISDREIRAGLLEVDKNLSGHVDFGEFIRWWSER